MAVRKRRADDWVDAQVASARKERAERERVEEQIRTERASALARPQITETRADGSRWTFTPAPGADLLAVEEIRRKLDAVKPHKDPGAPRPETIERYARRMARVHALPDVGPITVIQSGRGRFANVETWQRLPDDADEGAPRADADQVAADDARADHAVALATADAPTDEIAHARAEAAIAATVRAETRREFYGAGAWSRRDQRVRIEIIREVA